MAHLLLTGESICAQEATDTRDQILTASPQPRARGTRPNIRLTIRTRKQQHSATSKETRIHRTELLQFSSHICSSIICPSCKAFYHNRWNKVITYRPTAFLKNYELHTLMESLFPSRSSVRSKLLRLSI